MANPNDFIHPIIDAYLTRQRLDQEKVQSERTAAENARQNIAQEKFQQDQLKQQRELQDKAYELHQKELDLNKSQHEFTQRLGGLTNLRSMISEGAQFNKPQPGMIGVNQQGLPQGQIKDPLTGQVYDQSMFATPELAQQIKAGEAGAVAGATAQATLPYQQQLQQSNQTGQQQLERLRTTGDLEQEARAQRNKMEIVRIQEEGDNRRAELANRVRLQLGAGGQAYNPGAIENIQKNLYVTGTQDLSSIPAKDRKVFENNTPPGWVLRGKNPKDQAIIELVPRIEGLLNSAKQLADYSYDTHPLSTLVGTTGFGDVGALRNQLKSTAGAAAEILNKETGRKSEGDIQRAVEGLYSPKSSKSENLKNVDNAKEIFRSVVSQALAKYPEDQRKQILAANNIPLDYANPSTIGIIKDGDPKWLKDAPKSLSNGATILREESLKDGQPRYGR